MNAQIILFTDIGVFKESAIPYYFDNLLVLTLDSYLMAFSMY